MKARLAILAGLVAMATAGTLALSTAPANALYIVESDGTDCQTGDGIVCTVAICTEDYMKTGWWDAYLNCMV